MKGDPGVPREGKPCARTFCFPALVLQTCSLWSALGQRHKILNLLTLYPNLVCGTKVVREAEGSLWEQHLCKD